MKDALKKLLGRRNIGRLGIVVKCAQDLRHTYQKNTRAGYPVPMSKIASSLRDAGLKSGDILLIHSSLKDLLIGSPVSVDETPSDPLRYSILLIKTLKELLGPQGTLAMPTEGVKNALDFSLTGKFFDYRVTPSRRGLITDLFRRTDGAVRSVMPWYNMTASGYLATELMHEHEKSQPFAMDRHSPWFKLTERKGKVALLACGHHQNSIIRLPEMIYPEMTTLPVYYDKPLALRYRGLSGKDREARLWIRGVPHTADEVPIFADYLNNRYDIYQSLPIGKASCIFYDADKQFNALLAEMRTGLFPLNYYLKRLYGQISHAAAVEK